ncbi:DHH family phosphoesterase [Cohnella zeiphila]|uniref:Bifunctional oligoribonuclease/PAP phosphatase NrnA n=1 Tax=Cohnella zeiphila TaxID=2761120 RepID=A0A7X0SMT6_9BACL|nr:bifunctional oligoribonuclease/PAP phosphatase NrnA [Cohnella zeiphila]MBB6732898.1 bifunctional oligoribonuclease/PAP phosphatase NrnA [Cohnella zeiphila]
MMRERELDEAAAYVRERDDFLVVSHVQPDGDAISSTVAIGWLLDKLGKSFAMYNEGPVPRRLGYLWNSGDIATAAEGTPARRFRNVIAVDCADFARCGSAKERFAEDAELLNIDHHSTNDAYGRTNLIVPDAASTTEIVFRLIERMGISLDPAAATALYTGLLTDTGGFRYANTSPDVLKVAARLLDAGAEGPMLAETLLERMSMNQARMLQRTLPRLAFSDDQRIGWLWVTVEDLSETGASNEDLEGLVNYPRNVDGVEVGLLFKQLVPGSVKISLRSTGKVDVAAVAQRFGGGGHVRAAGCKLDADLPEAIERVVTAVQEALGDAG